VKDSSKRSLRTLIHSTVAFVLAIPTVVPLLDAYAHSLPGGDKLAVYGASLVVISTVVSKVFNVLEDAGVIPTWLKPTTPVSTTGT
jgi:hypothetical protein